MVPAVRAARHPPLHAPHLTARIAVHVVPRSAVTQVAGRHGDALKIRIAAPPADGAANAELIRFLAATLGVPRRDVAIASGHNSRRKTVTVSGMETAAVLRALEGAA